jgi:hypothetical protein
VPEWLREFVADVLAPEADVPEQVVAELAQLLPRTGALAPPPDGGDDQPDRANGAICLFLARRGVCVSGTSSDAHRVDLCRKAG